MLCDCYVKFEGISAPSDCYERWVALIRFLCSSLLHVPNGNGFYEGNFPGEGLSQGCLRSCSYGS